MLKFKDVENPVHEPTLDIIECIANAVLIDKELEKTPYKVDGVIVGSKGNVTNITEGLMSVLKKSTGLNIEMSRRSNQTHFIVVLKEE